MLSEGSNLGTKLGIEPVGPADGGAKVVDHQGLRQAAEVSKGIFQTAEEFIGGLMSHRFAVPLAAVGEHDAKDPTRLSSAISADEGRAPAKVHLRFSAGGALHSTHW